MIRSTNLITRSLVSLTNLQNVQSIGIKLRHLVIAYPSCHRSLHSTKLFQFKVNSLPLSKSKPVVNPTKKKGPVIEIWHGMRPKDLAKASGLTVDQVHELMQLCNVKWINSIEDVKLMLTKLNYRFTVVKSPSIDIQPEDEGIESMTEKLRSADGKDFKPRPPIVTIMGHVDHGKTTLLDSLRKSQIVQSEFGGITQHIGAFAVSLDEGVSRISHYDATLVKKIVTFLDTPGHAAFSSMRQRGANATDIVVLVIAADDGVMEQTIESIKYAQNANVPIIVAVNKMDKVSNVDEALKRIRTELNVHGIVTEADGGDCQMVTISALKGEGLRELKEAILALSETLQLSSPYDGGVNGTVIESRVDPHRGKTATILIKKGTLTKGSYLLAGDLSFCRVRAMFDEQTRPLAVTTPGFASQVIGWKEDELPEAGDPVYQFPDDKSLREVLKKAKTIRNQRRTEIEAMAAAEKNAKSRDEYVEKRKAKIEAGLPTWYRIRGPKVKTYQDDPDEPFKIRICIKADVTGSSEVLLDVIESYPNESSKVKLDLIHYGVGTVTENDIELASCFKNSVIYVFNVPLSPKIFTQAKEAGVTVKSFNVIYHFVDDLIKSINDLMPEHDTEVTIGEALVQKQFLIEEKRRSIPVAGCRCTKGPILKEDCLYKVMRGNETVASGLTISSMKHLKEDVKSIATNFECGLKFNNLPENFNFQPSDVLVCYKLKKVKPSCKWRPPGF